MTRLKLDQKWVAVYRNQGRNRFYESGRVYLVRIYKDEDVPRAIPQSGRTFRIFWEGTTHWRDRNDAIRGVLTRAGKAAAELNSEMRATESEAGEAA